MKAKHFPTLAEQDAADVPWLRRQLKWATRRIDTLEEENATLRRRLAERQGIHDQ